MLPAPIISEEICLFSEIPEPEDSLLRWMEKDDWEEDHVKTAQDKLLTKMQANEELLIRRFSQRATLDQYTRGEPNTYLLHVKKPGEALRMYLENRRLAWRYPSHLMERAGLLSADWVGMHPRLGEAILSMVAVTMANKEGFEMVTNDFSVHQTVLSNDPGFLFESLIQTEPPPVPDRQHTVHQLAQLVMTTAFDVSQFSARDIANIIRDGNDLRRWKKAIKRVVDDLPMSPDPSAREKALKNGAQQILNEWREYRRSLPKVLAGAFLELSAAAYAPTKSLVLGEALGLSIGVLAISGIRAYRAVTEGIKNDYQYLSRIDGIQHSLAFGLPSDVPS
jgi:hypothetical protein